jgi:hypothetical protein
MKSAHFYLHAFVPKSVTCKSMSSCQETCQYVLNSSVNALVAEFLRSDKRSQTKPLSFKFWNIARICALRELWHCWVEFQCLHRIGRRCHRQLSPMRSIGEAASTKKRTALGSTDPVRTDHVSA